MIKDEIKQKLLNFFSSLSDETRLMILLAIAKSPKTVS
jgi:DNA-binding transcriptional ArsR family regulator